ncbi:MAG: hypothetical protein H0S79_24680 [Anaerolineaceae bacterium]|nr:hypothetical protein [Anaerolineaceae bacterium]
MPECKGCGGSYDDKFAFCPYCGKAKPEPPKVNLEVNMVRKPTLEDCPKCGNDANIQKVSSIVSAGTSRGTNHSTSTGSTQYRTSDGTRAGNSTTSSSTVSRSLHQSDLAKMLRPPTAPVKKDLVNELSGAGIFIFVAIGGFIFEALFQSGGCYLIPAIVSSLIAVGIIISAFASKGKNEEKYQEEFAAYQKALYVWEHLYYCHKHDLVFMEGHKEWESVENAQEACYQWGKKFGK